MSRFTGLALLVTALALPLSGCELVADLLGGDTQVVDDIEVIMGERLPELDPEWSAATESEPDFSLASGEVLAVRLRYGGALAEESAWYQVRLDNPRNGWYDYVEYSAELGLGGGEDETGNYHDYRFSAENFNRQLTSENYDPQDVDGEYLLTITNSQGWSNETKLTAVGGRFEGSNIYVLEVP